MLRNDVNLNVSISMIRRYLKFRLGLSYKVVKTVTCNHNYLVNKLKR
jgi:hypothetical protein